MAAETKKQAWFMGCAAVLASLLGALIEQNVIPSPWNGVAVSVSMLLGSLVSPPGGSPRLSAAETETLLAELERRRVRATVPPRGERQL